MFQRGRPRVVFALQIIDSRFCLRHNRACSGAAFTKCFHNSSTILLRLFLLQFFHEPIGIHQILPKRGRIVELLWKDFARARTAKILPQFFPGDAAGRAPTKSFYNSSTILPRQQFTLVRGRLHVRFARPFLMSDKTFVADVCVFRVNPD